MGNSSQRGALVIGGAIVAALALGLVWKLRSHNEPAAKPAPASAATSVQPRTEQVALPAAGSAAQPPERNNDLVDEEGNARPQPVPVAGPTPAADTKTSAPAPAQKPFTREETITKREADLKLLDDQKTRLEADLAAAKTANNASAAHDLEVRIARITDLKKKRTTELEQIRAGGEVPQ